MSVNWGKIKSEYLKGMSRKAICEKYGVTYNSLDNHIKREKWTKRKTEIRKKVTEKVDDSVINDLYAQQLEFIREQNSIGLSIIQKGKEFFNVMESPNELKALTESMEKAIKICHTLYLFSVFSRETQRASD
jgi:hypothetical protein